MAQQRALTVLAASGFTNAAPIGSGAFGHVFRCTAPDGSLVAVKVAFETGRVAALREAESLRAVPPHPHLLSLVSFTEAPDHTLMVLPLATGGDTLRLMQDRGCAPLTEEDARGLFTQLLAAVEHLHRHGFVHRDLKCENIFLTGPHRRDVVVGDFGFVGRWRAGERQTEAWGSLHYSSPEIIAHAAYEGPEVDVWSMGVVLYAWCTGRLPFGGVNEEETSARIRTGAYSLPRHLSVELKALLAGMLETNGARRLSLEAVRAHPWVQPDAAADAYYDMRRRGSGAGAFFPAVPAVSGGGANTAAADEQRAGPATPKRRGERAGRTLTKRVLMRDDVGES